MKKIIICFVLIFCANLLIYPVEQPSTMKDSTEMNVASAKAIVPECDNNHFITDNDIDKIANKVINKMEQRNDKKAGTKLLSIVRWVAIGVVVIIILLLSMIIWGCHKIYKKLKAMERDQNNDTRAGYRHTPDRRIVITEEKIDKIAQDVEVIKKEVINDCKPMLKKTESQGEHDEGERNAYQPPRREPDKTIYAKPLQNGCLKTTEEMEAIYIIKVEQGNVARFTVYEKDEQMLRAIKNKEYILEQFCETRGSSINAKKIANVNAGQVEQIEAGIWRVIKKAEIMFIK